MSVPEPTVASRPVTWVIGVDGGGSKTEAVLGAVEPEACLPRIVATQLAGPSNLQRSPRALALNEVAQAIEGLFHQFPEARDAVASACFAMAGSGNLKFRAEFQQWLHERGWAMQTVITHDARPVIAAGTSRDAGIALIAGTGSIAYGLAADGREARCGGWSGLLGDEGSGYWIAREGYRRALHAVDGRGPATRLVESLSEWLGGKTVSQWPHQLSQLTPRDLAAAATVITTAAEQGDAVANEIVRVAAAELALMVKTLARDLFQDQSLELALAGGLLTHCQLLREALLRELEAHHVSLIGYQVAAHPAHGAARIAAQRIHRPSGDRC